MSKIKVGAFVNVTRNDGETRLGWIERLTKDYVTIKLWGEPEKFRTYNFNRPDKGTGVKEINFAIPEQYHIEE